MSYALHFDVVIPAHNAAATITDAVRSAWGQSYLPSSVTVIADACDDDTATLARAAGANVVEVQARSVAVARNVGASQGLSPWIAFLDADDLWRPLWLEEVAQQISNVPEAHLLFGEPLEVDGNGQATGTRRPIPGQGDLYKTLLVQAFITTSATVVRRASFLALGGFDQHFDQAGVEDYALWLRFAARWPLTPVAGLHVVYRRWPSSAMRSPQRFLQLRDQGLDIISTIHSERPLEPNLMAAARAHIFRLSAERLVHHGWTYPARQDLHQALILTPGDLRLWLLALLSCLHPTDRQRLLKLRRHLRRWRLHSKGTDPWLQQSH